MITKPERQLSSGRSASLIALAVAVILAAGCDILPGTPGEPVTYYVDATSGSDGNSGRSPESAWRTLVAVNERTVAEATVLFRRDGVFRGRLVPVSGSAVRPTVYGAYGTGALPELWGSVDSSDPENWSQTAANIWEYRHTFATDVGNLIFGDAASFGHKEWSLSDLDAQGDFFYDRATATLTLYSNSNPGTHYAGIEAALRYHVVDQQGASYVTYENIGVKYGGAHGFGGGNTHHIIIRDSEISYIGGGDLDMDGSNDRFGNGIEFWGNCHDNLVERNTIWEIYDSALSNQNHTEVVEQRDITYRNNVIWNTGMSSFEYWSGPESSRTRAITFEHNTASGAGEGWGAPPERPDTVGVHLLLPYSPAEASDLVVRNNIFSGGNLAIYMVHGFQWENSLELDYNCYFKAAGNLIEVEDTQEVFTTADLASWQSYSGADPHSLVADPQFTNAVAGDFSLLASSPCVDAGIAGDTPTDCDGVARPVGVAVDMGAYER